MSLWLTWLKLASLVFNQFPYCMLHWSVCSWYGRDKWSNMCVVLLPARLSQKLLFTCTHVKHTHTHTHTDTTLTVTITHTHTRTQHYTFFRFYPNQQKSMLQSLLFVHSSSPSTLPPKLLHCDSLALKQPCAIEGQFHQRSTSSFYARSSQERKKAALLDCLFCAFGICARKSCS